MNGSQPRVQSGVPGGGRWTGQNHPESGVQLFDRLDGTFLHPAPFKTAEKCIEFWSTVEIPDEIIDQVTEAYHQAWEAESDARIDAAMEAWQQQWFAANPQPTRDKHIAEWDAKFKAEREPYRLSVVSVVEEQLASERPQYLGEYDAPQLIRAARMWYHAPNADRFPEEDAKVGGHPIELFDGFTTVDEIEEKYKLSSIGPSMERIYPDDSTDRIVDALSSLGDDTFAVQQQVLRSADQLNL